MVPQIQTITLNKITAGGDALPLTGGTFRFKWFGEFSSALNYTATAAAMKAAIEAMTASKEYPGGPVTVTCSAAFNAGASFTITFADARNYPRIQVAGDSLTTAADKWSADTIVTTNAVRGWTSGTYDVMLYAFRYQTIKHENGKLSVIRY